METETQIIGRLRNDGYVADLRFDDDGRIRSDGTEFSPEQAVVHHVARVEGQSNPDDLAIILAISGPKGLRGTLVLPFGPDLSGPQADAVRNLTSSRAGHDERAGSVQRSHPRRTEPSMATDDPHEQNDPVPVIETDSGERQLDPDAERPAESAIEATEILDDAAHRESAPNEP